ncbi:MAG: hypothetical protein U9R60_01670 [Bacteroidota bacterium]|nr:hypothetical protein [Bacteroidota bacterium]
MNNSSIKWKLQWPYAIISFVFVVSLIIEDQAFNTYFLAYIYGLALIVIGILFTIRYKMFQPLLSFGWTGLFLWHYFLASHPADIVKMLNLIGIYSADSQTVVWISDRFTMVGAIIHMLTLFIINLFLFPALWKSNRLEKSARRIFKLAAEMVTDTSNGFTGRPYYAGQEEYNKNEIIGLARYLNGKDISRYTVSPKSVQVGFSMGRSPLADKTFQKISHISFANDGKVMVQISEQDYKMYRNQLTFNQLCEALSNVFTQFLDYYKNGNEERIITELKSI